MRRTCWKSNERGNRMPCSPIPQEYTLIFGINFLQTATPTALNEKNSDGTTAFIEDMAVTTDPIIEAPPPAVAGILPKTGRTWLYQASRHADPGALRYHAGVNPPPCVNSQTGNDNPPVGAPSNDARRRAVLLLSGVTHARGLLWLQTNWWVSDEDHGFCRIDQNPITGAAAMTHCFQTSGGSTPGLLRAWSACGFRA